MFSRQNNELFGENIFRSSLPELFCEKGVLKNFAKFGKHLCWKLPTLLKGTPAQVLSCELSEIFKTTYIVKHLKTSASVYCQANANINMEKSWRVTNLSLFHLI